MNDKMNEQLKTLDEALSMVNGVEDDLHASKALRKKLTALAGEVQAARKAWEGECVGPGLSSALAKDIDSTSAKIAAVVAALEAARDALDARLKLLRTVEP